MKRPHQIEWSELREIEDEHRRFFVVATRVSGQWRFEVKETWEKEYQSVPPSLRLFLIAEYLKEAIIRGAGESGDSCDLEYVGNSSLEELRFADELDASSAKSHWWKWRTTTPVQLRDFHWPDVEKQPEPARVKPHDSRMMKMLRWLTALVSSGQRCQPEGAK